MSKPPRFDDSEYSSKKYEKKIRDFARDVVADPVCHFRPPPGSREYKIWASHFDQLERARQAANNSEGARRNAPPAITTSNSQVVINSEGDQRNVSDQQVTSVSPSTTTSTSQIDTGKSAVNGTMNQPAATS